MKSPLPVFLNTLASHTLAEVNLVNQFMDQQSGDRAPDLLAGLNPAQREAVESVGSPVLVLAGPGSGKTRVLTNRVALLVDRYHVPAYRIMAVTFTNKAAREMKERLLTLIGDRVNELAVGTFHANCARILRREGHVLGLPSNFNIYDSDDQLSLIRQAIKEQNVDDKRFAPRSVQGAISQAKSELTSPEDYRPATYWHEVAGRIYARYQELLAANGALDFDDLLMKAAVLFTQHADVLARYQERYLHILVDEFQDTNAAQYELVSLLTRQHRNLFVVGDEDQSIYSWRGADYRNMQRFTKDYPDARLVLLEQNYRSTQTILDTANAVISRNKQRTRKVLHTDRQAGVKVFSLEANDESEESEIVVREIERQVKAGACKLGDVAVMYRTNAQSRSIEDAFVAAGIPYRLVGATRFYERREVKDLLAYLRVIHNPHDNVSLMRIVNVPPRAIGATTVSALGSFATRLGISLYDAIRALPDHASAVAVNARGQKALQAFLQIIDELIAARSEVNMLELFDRLIERSGYPQYIRDGSEEGEERWENVMELRSVASEYAYLPVGAGLTVFLEEVSLVSDVDNLPEQTDAPTLLTLHAAKGLEFGAVFIVGMNEGLLPHSRSVENPEAMEEERRLCYVGITRAKDRLYLLHTFRRSQHGSYDFSEPSRFLADIPPNLIEGQSQKQARQSQLNLGAGRYQGRSAPPVALLPRTEKQPEPVALAPRFKAGDRVIHPSFGEGLVVESKLSGGDEEVSVAFKGRGIKRLMAGFANLQKVNGE